MFRGLVMMFGRQSLAFIAAALLTTGVQVTVAQGDAPSVVDSPQGSVTAVTAVSASDIWAVGEHTTPRGHFRSLALHWDGTGWQRVDSPSPGGLSDSFRAVASVSSSDVWAVGDSLSRPADPDVRTLIAHWDGNSWSQVASPNPKGTYRDLSGIAAVSATDIWAVGSYWLPHGSQVSLTLHWDGSSWTQVPSPSFGAGTFLSSVSAFSDDDVWAAGGSLAQKEYPPLILHWDGRQWSRVKAGATQGFKSEGLLGISVGSETDAWAVGWGFKSGGFIEHWDGTTWSDAVVSNAVLYGVDTRSPTDAWAAGAVYNGDGIHTRAAIMHWDGATWSLVRPESTLSIVTSICAITAGDVWAVGNYRGQDAETHYLVLHFNGDGWQRLRV